MSISYSREKDRRGLIVSLLVDLAGYVIMSVCAPPVNQHRHQQAHAFFNRSLLLFNPLCIHCHSSCSQMFT